MTGELVLPAGIQRPDTVAEIRVTLSKEGAVGVLAPGNLIFSVGLLVMGLWSLLSNSSGGEQK